MLRKKSARFFHKRRKKKMRGETGGTTKTTSLVMEEREVRCSKMLIPNKQTVYEFPFFVFLYKFFQSWGGDMSCSSYFFHTLFPSEKTWLLIKTSELWDIMRVYSTHITAVAADWDWDYHQRHYLVCSLSFLSLSPSASTRIDDTLWIFLNPKKCPRVIMTASRGINNWNTCIYSSVCFLLWRWNINVLEIEMMMGPSFFVGTRWTATDDVQVPH